MLKKALPLLVLTTLLLASCNFNPFQTKVSGPPMQGCRVVDVLPKPNPTITALIPAVTASDHILGAKDAPITILEYSDLQCPYCALVAPVLHELLQRYPKDVRLVFRFFPLSGHANALVSAYAVEAAGRQGKFFEFGDFLFANQEKWAGLSNEEATQWFIEQAASLKINPDQMAKDMNGAAVQNVVNKSLDVATSAGIPGTPFLFINDQPYQGNSDIETLSAWVRFFQMEDKAYKICPPVITDPKKTYQATFKTDKGDVVIKLLPDKAPLAVNNFVFLAREGWYNNTTFHRVLKGFVAQGGDPSGSGYGGPGYEFDNEYKNAVYDRPGLLAMANTGENTNGSQFFITLDKAPNLNGGYTLFGEVTSGLDVLNALTLRDPDQAATSLPPGDKLISVTIQEK